MLSLCSCFGHIIVIYLERCVFSTAIDVHNSFFNLGRVANFLMKKLKKIKISKKAYSKLSHPVAEKRLVVHQLRLNILNASSLARKFRLYRFFVYQTRSPQFSREETKITKTQAFFSHFSTLGVYNF